MRECPKCNHPNDTVGKRCSNCNFEIISDCPHGCKIGLDDLIHIGGDLYRCPQCRNFVYATSWPFLKSDGSLHEPLIRIIESYPGTEDAADEMRRRGI